MSIFRQSALGTNTFRSIYCVATRPKAARQLQICADVRYHLSSVGGLVVDVMVLRTNASNFREK